MPFIALTERAFTELVNANYGVLERGLALQERLERLVIEERGLGSILDAIGSVGRRKGSASRRRTAPRLPGMAWTRKRSRGWRARSRPGRAPRALPPSRPRMPPLASSAVIVPLPDGGHAPAGTWLAVVKAEGELTELDRLIARQAAIAVALELMRERVVRETERRLAGDVLADALSGRLDDDEVRGRLRPFGIGAEAAVLVFEIDDPVRVADELEAALEQDGVPALVAVSSAPRSGAALRGRRRRRRATRSRSPARRAPRWPGIAPASAPLRAASRPPVPSTARSTRRAAPSRRPRWPTATRPTSPPTATSAPSPCCSRFRTTRPCASTRRACSPRSRARTASTAASCCAPWRRSSSRTDSGSGPHASSTATATRSAIGSARSRS